MDSPEHPVPTSGGATSVVETVEAAEEAARQQRRWSVAASAAKRHITWWRGVTYVAIAVGAILTTLATQVAHLTSGIGRLLAVAGGILVAVVPVIRAWWLSKERIRDWT